MLEIWISRAYWQKRDLISIRGTVSNDSPLDFESASNTAELKRVKRLRLALKFDKPKQEAVKNTLEVGLLSKGI